jgi:hypothetical protein
VASGKKVCPDTEALYTGAAVNVDGFKEMPLRTSSPGRADVAYTVEQTPLRLVALATLARPAPKRWSNFMLL